MTNNRKSRNRRLKKGQKVILTMLPPGFVDGMPEEDQKPVLAVLGRPVKFEKYERNGTVELEFMDKDDVIHSIWVEPKFVTPWRASAVRKYLQERPRQKRSHTGIDPGNKRLRMKVERGQRVVLKALPTEVIGMLSQREQQFISALVGKPIVFFSKYVRDGRAELEFVDHENTAHLIYVDPRFIKIW